MCLAPGAAVPRPPAELVTSTAVRVSERTVGGGRTRVVLAEPSGAARLWPVLVLPDGRGLTHSYVALVELLARCGVLSAGVDLHGPVAGSQPRADELEQQFSRSLRWPVLRSDLVEASSLLRAVAGAGEIVVVGFCLGGRVALLSGGSPELAVCETLALYPDPVGPARGEVPAPIAHVDELHGHVQLLTGGADAFVPAESIDRYAAALAGASVSHEVVRYPGAPHSFFDRGLAADHPTACTDVWHRIVAAASRR